MIVIYENFILTKNLLISQQTEILTNIIKLFKQIYSEKSKVLFIMLNRNNILFQLRSVCSKPLVGDTIRIKQTHRYVRIRPTGCSSSR